MVFLIQVFPQLPHGLEGLVVCEGTAHPWLTSVHKQVDDNAPVDDVLLFEFFKIEQKSQNNEERTVGDRIRA
jgi:hypothetical protein